MKYLIRMLIAIVSCLVLTACINIKIEDTQSDVVKDKQPTKEQTEEDSDKDTNPDATEEEEEEPTESEPTEDVDTNEVVAENEAFQIFEPAPNTEVKNQVVVRGLARVFEGTIQYAFEDGHFIIDKGFTTASEGGPEWGEFEITINLADATDGLYRIVLYEESAKDGSILHELIIPVQVIN